MGYILIGADFVPTPSNMKYFCSGEKEQLFDEELTSLIEQASYRIFNLEFPITDVVNPIKKCGTNFSSPQNTIALYKRMPVDLFTMANNHILDQGEKGLIDTIGALNNSGISYVGAGRNLSEAKEPFYFEYNGYKCGVYGLAEHEFSIATENTAGANPLNELQLINDIHRVRENCSYLIVLFHGGKEEYRYPTSHLQQICRTMVASGADLVICQHSHCIGCFEEYEGGSIIYGQGNFLFDDEHNEYWDTSILIKICDKGNIEFIPIVRENYGVRLATDTESIKILNEFYLRSDNLKDPKLLEIINNQEANRHLEHYLLTFAGIGRKNLLFRLINKISGHRYSKLYIKYKYNEQSRINLLNIIECEAHRDMLTRGLRGTIYNENSNGCRS